MSLANVERTHWRDAEISRRHRRWGFNCPSIDLDFVLVEYGLGQPVAIIEYKHVAARAVDLEHPSYRALAALADASAIPFWIVRYRPDLWCFEVQPANEWASALGPRRMMSEREYVGLLHDIRGAVIQEQVLRHLRDELPGELPAATLW